MKMLPRIWNLSHNGRFKYTYLSRETLNEGLEIMRTAFYPDEIISQVCEVPSNPKAIGELVNLARDSVNDGISTVCIDSLTNKLAGVHINKLLHKNEESIFQKHIKLCKEEQSKAYCQFMIEADSKLNLFEYFHANCGIESMMVCVAPQYRGMGLSYQFLKSVKDIATAMHKGDPIRIPLDVELLSPAPKPQFLCGVRTTFKTKNSKDQLGFKLLKTVKFNEHVVNGKKAGEIIGDVNKEYAIEAMALE